MPCLRNFWPWDRPGVPGGTMNVACPRLPRLGSTDATTTWTSAIPPLVAHVFVPFSTHSSVASSYTARVRMAATSLPASGSDEQNAPSLTSPGVPNICGSHSPICSFVPLLAPRRRPGPTPTSDRPIPASPQNSSSNATGGAQAARVEPLRAEEVERVQPDLGRFLDDRPRRLLALVPLGGSGPDHVPGERHAPSPWSA